VKVSRPHSSAALCSGRYRGSPVPFCQEPGARSASAAGPNADVVRMIVIARTATPAPRRSGRSGPSLGPAISSLSHESTGPGIAELTETYPSERTRENWAAQLFASRAENLTPVWTADAVGLLMRPWTAEELKKCSNTRVGALPWDQV
jgi:hypothetical protein